MDLPGSSSFILPAGGIGTNIKTEMDESIDAIRKFKQHAQYLIDPSTTISRKVEVVQEIGEQLESIIGTSIYPQLLEHLVSMMLLVLQQCEPQFLSDNPCHQLRKLCLEITHRLPANDTLKPFAKQILSTIFNMLDRENEENVLVCLKIIIELHKQYRPQIQPEISHFLTFVSNIYKQLPNNIVVIFEEKPIFGPFAPSDSLTGATTSNTLTKGSDSLKVLAELPIIVVLMYQLYKANVHPIIVDFIPDIISCLQLGPLQAVKELPNFDKELYADFIAAQIKTLSFLAYMIRSYQELICTYHTQIVKGVLTLLYNCPPEVAHLRKELLIATRHILATNLRENFLPQVHELFNEDLLVSKGWTSWENLRPLAYSTLADMVHHVRANLTLPNSLLAVHLFSKNVHDDTLPIAIQTLSCKLLLNLVEGIRSHSNQSQTVCFNILSHMLDVFIHKFKVLSKIYIPDVLYKVKQISMELPVSTTSPPASPQKSLPDAAETSESVLKATQILSQQMADYRTLVKTLVCGVKTLTWGLNACHSTDMSPAAVSRHYDPPEIIAYVDLVEYGLKSLDVYKVQAGPRNTLVIRQSSVQTTKLKEEKETLEHFAGIFTSMPNMFFKEIFATKIGYIVDRISENYALQIIVNSFLASTVTSASFATIMINYLLENMEELGKVVDHSALYLKLFKLVFGSVSLFANENEQMLKPHLSAIVIRSMDLAQSAKEPFNYFLLLRALFRSIGGGSHDLLYQEFLPLLPDLLQGLNHLQCGLHKQHMKDLFVELCLTVPVRLSTLLPYLPMLMDPLVSALHGSQSLVNQGLRTLELCVDNLQPDFLYEHIQPVRAELMQALWETLRNSNEQIAHSAFRILGKFGGGNRRMIMEPQVLQYHSGDVGPCLTLHFDGVSQPILLPVKVSINTAFQKLKSTNVDIYYRRQAWEVVKCYLISVMDLSDTSHKLLKLFQHIDFKNCDFKESVPKPVETADNSVYVEALTSAFLCAAIKDLRPCALPFLANIVRHFTMLSVANYVFGSTAKSSIQNINHDDILLESISICMGHEEKELCKIGELIMNIIVDTVVDLVGSKDRACRLPLFDSLAEKLVLCCYERSWFVKQGGCLSVRFLIDNMTLVWVLGHALGFLRSLFFVILDLSGEVSNGTIDVSKDVINKLLMRCATPCDIMSSQQNNVLASIIKELVSEVTNSNNIVRHFTMECLNTIANLKSVSVSELISPHKEVIGDMIPPRKHKLRNQPLNAQIGLLEGNTYCTSLEPSLFSYDLSITEHQAYLTELCGICECDDIQISKLPCYKDIKSTIPLRAAALKCLASCHYLTPLRDKIFRILFKTLDSTDDKLQIVGFETMKQFLSGCSNADFRNEVHNISRPLLTTLGDHKHINYNVATRLSGVTKLFPHSFNERLCDQLIDLLKKWLNDASISGTGNDKPISSELEICTAILNIFREIPAASSKLLEPLVTIILKGERDMCLETSSPFRAPLIGYLLRYPAETVEVFFGETMSYEEQWRNLFVHMVKHKDAQPLRLYMESSPHWFKDIGVMFNSHGMSPISIQQLEVEYFILQVITSLTKNRPTWLLEQVPLYYQLHQLWMNDNFHNRQSPDALHIHWREIGLVCKCLFLVYKINHNDFNLLFELLRVFTYRNVYSFNFLKKFIDTDVVAYDISKKREMFFKFIELYHDPMCQDSLKTKVMQYIIIPCFESTLKTGSVDDLIGGEPNPDMDLPENIISVFIGTIIDPAKPYGVADGMRIMFLQFSSLLVEYASLHIHDIKNKKQGDKLRRLMTYAWSCLLNKQSVDPCMRYHGHLLLSHIIAKFAIHRRIVLQVFHSLLKAHAVEARSVVKQALDILTPAIPNRMDDGNNMLQHWTKKIIIEEGQSVGQLVHILSLIVKQHDVYYPVRHQLIPHIITAIQRLGFTATASIDHKKLAGDLVDIILKWEMKCARDKRFAEETNSGGNQDNVEYQTSMSIDKLHSDAICNFLLRIVCTAADNTNAATNQGEMVSLRCGTLLKTALSQSLWPDADLKLSFMDKILHSIDQSTPTVNYTNIYTILEFLHYLLDIMSKSKLLSGLKSLQRSLASCLSSDDSKVVKYLNQLLSKMFVLFPIEPWVATPTGASRSEAHLLYAKFEELENLYAAIAKNIVEGLVAYEKTQTGGQQPLYSVLLLMKSACSVTPNYGDRLLQILYRCLQKAIREHVMQATSSDSISSEVIALMLDLLKSRFSIMQTEMKRSFIQMLVGSLIEKSPCNKAVGSVVKIMDDWMKSQDTTNGPSIREKSIILIKLMINVEKRFADDQELVSAFLDLVHGIYNDSSFAGSELTAKLEPAFMSGLKCSIPKIRAKFFDLINSSMSKSLYIRMLYIISAQNWEHMGHYFWIKQVIEMLLCSVDKSLGVACTTPEFTLPAVSNFLPCGVSSTDIEMASAPTVIETYDLDTLDEDSLQSAIKPHAEQSPEERLVHLASRHSKFISSLKDATTLGYLNAFAQLCRLDAEFAHKSFVILFPRLWAILPQQKRDILAGEIGPFLCSGSHNVQRDCHPSAINTVVEALSNCLPPVFIQPLVLKFLAKTHNLWHRACLTLERTIAEHSGFSQNKSNININLQALNTSQNTTNLQECMDALADIYGLLQEDDLFAALWISRCKMDDTAVGLRYEQQGFYQQARQVYEEGMDRARSDYNISNNPLTVLPELRLWEQRWIRCSRELNDWTLLKEYGSSRQHPNPHLVLECAWRVPNWNSMKDALQQVVEGNCPKDMVAKVNLYRGYLAICHPDEQHLNVVERLVEMSSSQAIRDWRRLPYMVSHAHIPYLQLSQQIMELQEASNVQQGLVTGQIGRNNSIHDMKGVVKTWKNRLPTIADDLSHWSDILMWRQHHYQAIVNAYEGLTAGGGTVTPPSSVTGEQQTMANNSAMLGVHASAQAIILYGKIARKQGSTGVCLDTLSQIHTIPSVPILDCFQKIKQQVKCYLQMANVLGNSELQQGLELIESTNLKYFIKDMIAEFYALKGTFLAQVGQSDEANNAFSAAVQLHDTSAKSWSSWGEYIEQVFIKNSRVNIQLATEAVICFLHATRHQNEPKARKYIAKVFWFLSFDDSQEKLSETVERYAQGVPPVVWLPWIPQLMTCLVRKEGKQLLHLASTVARNYPQAVYFPIRTLYLILKIEQREKFKLMDSVNDVGASSHSDMDVDKSDSQIESQSIRATPSMWRCSRIMNLQRDIHPSLLASLEGIVDRLIWFRENWYEEVLRHLRQGLSLCYTAAFEQRRCDCLAPPQVIAFISKLITTFGSSQDASLSLMGNSGQRVATRDTGFQKLKQQFIDDLNLKQPGSSRLHTLIQKLKKWVNILEAKCQLLPKLFLLEEKCRFLSNFSNTTADVRLPGEFLLPKHSHYLINIVRFLPRVNTVYKHGSYAKRLTMRGSNGKIYPYLVMNDSMTESRREERVLQFLRLINNLFCKRKETAKRFIGFSLPAVVPISPQMRLIEEDESSLSLFDIYKESRKNRDYYSPLSKYYDKLNLFQSRGLETTNKMLIDIFTEIQSGEVSESLVRRWALRTYPTPTEYCTFRRQFCNQMSLLGFVEFVLHLDTVAPSRIELSRESGCLKPLFYHFDLMSSGVLDANRAVPFRLTPNLRELLTPTAVRGSLTANMVAIARCLIEPNFSVESVLRAIFRDEIIYWDKKRRHDVSNIVSDDDDLERCQLINLVDAAVSSISMRLQNMAEYRGGESKVTTLVAAAESPDNLALMDPAWFPWL